jgi:hypothetical protein
MLLIIRMILPCGIDLCGDTNPTHAAFTSFPPVLIWWSGVDLVGGVDGSQAKTLALHAAVGLDVPRSRAAPRLALLVLGRLSARSAGMRGITCAGKRSFGDSLRDCDTNQ